MKKVTIAIPFFNAEKFLSKAIESVIYQTYKDWSLILIDDGSIDGSLDIAKHYASIDERIRVYSDGCRKNLGARLNEVPFLVDSLYLARMDADDIMHPLRLEKQIDVLSRFPEIDVLGTNAYTIDDKDFVVGIRLNPINIEELVKVDSFIHPTIIAKTEWFRNNQYDVNANRIEDVELWFRTSQNNNFQILIEPLFFYREFGNRYYSKYLLAQKSKEYIETKYPKNRFWNSFFKLNYCKFLLYYVFNIFKSEAFFINRRNQVLFKKKSYYLTYFE